MGEPRQVISLSLLSEGLVSSGRSEQFTPQSSTLVADLRPPDYVSMDLTARLVELSKEYKITVYEQSEFTKCSKAPPDSKDGFTTTYEAHMSTDPTSRVMIKKFLRIPEGNILGMYSKRKEDTETRTWTYFKRECRIWNADRIHHPNVIKFFGVMKQSEDQLPAFVTELAREGSLYQFIVSRRAESLDLCTKMKLLCDVANGLVFLHDRNVVHRNLETSHIMLDRAPDGMFKALLDDFGSAKDFAGLIEFDNSTNRTSFIYSSPEQLRSPHTTNSSKDIWSLGCVTLQFVTCSIGIWPVDYTAKIIQGHLLDGGHPPRPRDISEMDKVWNFIITRCWCEEPEKRATAGEAAKELEQIK